MSGQEHVVFVMMPSTGHVNPTLPILHELTARGVAITYYVHEQFRTVVEAAGARWVHMQRPHDLTDEQVAKYLPGRARDECVFPASAVPVAAAVLPKLLEELDALQPHPSLIAYDPFLPQGLVAAKQLGIPAVSLLSYTGPGVVSCPPTVTEAWESSEAVQRAWRQIRDAYGVDVFEHGTIGEFYSPDRNTVATIDSLFAPPASAVQKARLGAVPFKCIGPMIAADVRISHGWASDAQVAKELPWQTILNALAQSKRFLYISLGTVATSSFWARKFGGVAVSNGLEGCTGKEFLQFVLRASFEAFGQEEDLLVLAAIGPHADALEGLPAAPQNFILQEVVPQLEVLQKCHAFVTHGGANSLHEALSLNLPLVVVPMFGDQPLNADALSKAGAATCFKKPLQTLTPSALRNAVRQMLDPRGQCLRTAKELGRQIASQGGAKQAAEFLLTGRDGKTQHGAAGLVKLAGA